MPHLASPRGTWQTVPCNQRPDGRTNMASTFGKGCHLHLIDGSAYIFRAFHALPPLTRKSDGLPIGAVSGFCNMLHRYVEGNTGPDAPTHVVVVFDKGSHTFRNDMYDLYKANREEMPEDLRPQIPLTRQATEAFNIACKEIEGFEADDIMATLAHFFFFEQETAYEILRSDWSSDVCSSD